MNDDQIDELLRRAAEGDLDAQTAVDAWIAEALGPLCTTEPLSDDQCTARWSDMMPWRAAARGRSRAGG